MLSRGPGLCVATRLALHRCLIIGHYPEALLQDAPRERWQKQLKKKAEDEGSFASAPPIRPFWADGDL